MADTKTSMNLGEWLSRITRAKNRAEVYAILDEFRPLTWTDNERSQMSKHYMKIIDLMPPEVSDDDKSSGNENKAGEGDDGPVWYEKM